MLPKLLPKIFLWSTNRFSSSLHTVTFIIIRRVTAECAMVPLDDGIQELQSHQQSIYQSKTGE